jgi:glycosyltransferase involved in cell wall biosynthesis
MRLAFGLHTLNPATGGVVSATVELAKSLRTLGHEVTLVTFDDPSEAFLPALSQCLKILPLGPARNSYGYISNLEEKLSTHTKSFDFLILSGLWLYSTFGLASWARRQKIPYAIFPHGMLDPYFARAYPLKHLKKLIYYFFFEFHSIRNASAICYTTTSERDLAQKTFPLFSHQRQEIIGLCVEQFTGDISAAKEVFYSRFPVLRQKPFILYLSRFHRKKGVDLLLKALKKFPGATLVMAGPTDESSCDPMFLQELKSLSTDNVYWVGMLTGEVKWGALAAAQALILPSHQENFGMVVAEALSVKTPVLVTPAVALSTDVLRYKAGIIAPDTLFGVESLLKNFFSLSPDERANMSLAAAECYRDNYQPSAVASRLQNLIQEILKRNKS